MSITEKSLNRFLTGAVVLQVCMYPPKSLHIMFENRAMLTVYIADQQLAVDLVGPSVAESPNVERQVEVEP